MTTTSYDDQFIERPTTEDMANKYQRDAAYWREQAEAKDAEIAELVQGVREYIETDGGIEELERFLVKYEPKTDPLLIEAREIAKEALDPSSHSKCGCRDEIDRGEWDNKRTVKAALAALRRGMEMAREACHDR